MPWINYTLQRDYFARELCQNKNKLASCCKGICQVKRMVKESADTDPSHPQPSRICVEDVPFSLAPEAAWAVEVPEPRLQHSMAELPMPDYTSIAAIWHPPAEIA